MKSGLSDGAPKNGAQWIGFGHHGWPGTLILALLALLCCTARINAQAKFLGAVSGVVTDSAGARVANASVTVTAVTTRFVTKGTTGNTGVFTIQFLSPDTYDVTVTAQGFDQETKTGVVVTAGDTANVPIALKVGSPTVSLTVTADAVQLNTTSAQIATTFTTQEVLDTPLVGHNPFILSQMGAGVYTGGYMQAKASTNNNQFGAGATGEFVNGKSNGSRQTIDGLPDDPGERGGGFYGGFTPSPEAVQSVQLQSTSFDAQLGRGVGSTNVVLRAGTNQYHGSVYYAFQNTYMNANTSERVPNQHGSITPSAPTPRTNDQTNQPGFVLDGPATIPHLYDGHDRTYFMVAYERVQARLPISGVAGTNGIVPTPAMRTGDFSGLCSSFDSNGICLPGAGQQIYDPTQPTASNGNRVPFPYNKIPSSYFAAGTPGAPGAAMMAMYPQPNVTPTASSPNNYIPTTGATYAEKYFSIVGRVDHSFSASDKLNASFFKAILNQLVPNDNFPTAIGPSGLDYTVWRNNVGGHLQNVWTPSATLAVDAHVGLINHPFGLLYKGSNYNLNSLGINASGIPVQSFPGTSFSDPNGSYMGLQAGAAGQVSNYVLVSPGVIVSKTRGRHNLRIGYDGDVIRYPLHNPLSGFGTFGFNRQFTQQNSNTSGCPAGETCTVNGDKNSGNAFAALLIGVPSSGSYANNIAYEIQQFYQAAFIQDDWRLSDRLTVNLGLRWDVEAAYTERFNRLVSNFCTSCVNPMQSEVSGLALYGGLQFVNYGNRTPYPTSYKNWQPRLGTAYQLTNRVVLRGGFGTTYFNTFEAPISTGFSQATSFVATTDNVHPATYFSQPFPSGVVAPTGNSLGLATALGQSVSFIDPNHVQPRIMQWSVSVEAQAPGNLQVTAAYVGQQSSRLEVNKSINGLPRQYYNNPSLAAYLNTKVPNPMYHAALLPASSSLNTPTILQSSLLVPYPEFTGVSQNIASVGQQDFNSLQISAVRPMSHGLSLQGNLTWQKMMDQNVFLNPGQDDLAHPFRYQDAIPALITNVIGTYQVPALIHSTVGHAILGNWTLNTVFRWFDGFLVASPGGVDEIGNPKISNPTNKHYFNTCYENASGQLVIGTGACSSASDTPAFKQHPSGFWLNTIGPDMESVRFHGIHPILDASLFKTVKIHENYNFEIRGEAYNVANTPNFGNPSNALGGSNFGSVAATQANDPRILQLTARFNF